MSQSAPGLHVFGFAKQIIEEAEVVAAGLSLSALLERLRLLSMEDFGKLLISMPNVDFPNLSGLLPRMADDGIQIQWTGAAGLTLLARTVAFARIVETAFVRHIGRPLQGATIMDFGVGYGRNARSMLYYTDPSNIYGVDAWHQSLEYSRRDGVPCRLLLSDAVPDRLPVPDGIVDIAFAFSIFTHLSHTTATAALGAIRKTMKPNSVAVFTIRPKEYWLVPGQQFSEAQGKDLLQQHETSRFAFIPQSADGTYGDTSMEASFFSDRGWRVLGYETTMTNPYQVAMVVRPGTTVS